MFLEFQKITNTNVSTAIMINARELLTLGFDNFENNGTIINKTHLEIGNPKYQFYTPSSLANIEAALNVLDITSGFVPGDPCAGGNAIVIVAPASEMPLIKVRAIVNNTFSQTREVVLNPRRILYMENLTFIDYSGTQVTGLMIIMTDSNRTRFVANITYADMFNVIGPIVVA